MAQVNLQSLNSVELAAERIKEQLRGLREHEGFLLVQLATIPSTQEENEDKTRLEQLKIERASRKTRYTHVFPEVARTQVEIAKLEQRLAAAAQ